MKSPTILGLGLTVVATSLALAGPGSCDHEGKRAAMRAVAEASFTEADVDGSGALTPDEFTAFHEIIRAKMEARRFERADANGDGTVTQDELAAARERHHGRGKSF